MKPWVVHQDLLFEETADLFQRTWLSKHHSTSLWVLKNRSTENSCTESTFSCLLPCLKSSSGDIQCHAPFSSAHPALARKCFIQAEHARSLLASPEVETEDGGTVVPHLVVGMKEEENWEIRKKKTGIDRARPFWWLSLMSNAHWIELTPSLELYASDSCMMVWRAGNISLACGKCSACVTKVESWLLLS